LEELLGRSTSISNIPVMEKGKEKSCLVFEEKQTAKK